MKSVYERATNRKLDVPDDKTPPSPPGVYGFISYERLCAMVETADENIRSNETVTHLEFDRHGVHTRLGKRP